ncbi:MAG TPA: pitrilysin family protein [Burkholderiaceae bacterium]|jgi:zinc protease|nr:pitrilysin family protein [Burkholderiaceae bacterium]
MKTPLLATIGAFVLAVATGFGAATALAQGPTAPPTNDGNGGIAAPAQAVERTLPNGLKVIVKQDRRAPTAVHMVWYRAGSVDEVNGRTGVAHVLEHMMFKGTEKLAPGEFSRRVSEMGGRENAFTSRDYTGYFQQVHKSRLPEVMALEADRMANLKLSEDEFKRELLVVMEERRWRTEDRAQSIVYEQLMAHAFIASPYRTPVIGWMRDLQAMTVDDAQAWYDAWYAPNNAVLMVAGDVEPEQVFELAAKTYGKIPSRPLPARKPQGEPPQRGIKRIDVKAPAENAYVIMAFKVPKLENVDGDSDAYALEVLSSLLDSYDGARFPRNVVRGSRIANQAGAGYSMTQRGPALFYLDGTPAEGHTTADVERALRAEIARIAAEGVPAQELKRVIAQYVSSQVYKRDSVMAQAMELAQLEIVGFSHRDADRILERIRQVTPEQVQSVAARYFNDDDLTVATLLPQPITESRPPAPPPGLRH